MHLDRTFVSDERLQESLGLAFDIETNCNFLLFGLKRDELYGEYLARIHRIYMTRIEQPLLIVL
jgi:hypothetical protein